MKRIVGNAGAALVVSIATSVVLSACGGAPMAEPARSAVAAAPATPAASVESQAEAAPSVAADAAGESPRTTGVAAATFDRSATQLDASLGDCRQACRALASMDRACGSLCSLQGADADPARCADDTTRLKGARDRVRAACVTCPDGTRVDREAPVPSTAR